MRLLNTRTLRLTTFVDEVPEYVILSHRWEEEELVFEDLTKEPVNDISDSARTKRGFSKVQGTCTLAVKDGFDWAWIDSCCIDKSSSAELQEAINSMFRWYQEAQICYAYLSDISDGEAGFDESFKKSLWFTRGWTLQELLAPCSVEFYAADWTPIGSKASRAKEIASITRMDCAAIEKNWADSKDAYSAAEKMSWAAHRLVTRAEDLTYCLLGLFDVNMPLLYGEGNCNAFRRLQQAIFEGEADYTLFLFSNNEIGYSTPYIAYSPRQFCRRSPCRDCALRSGCLPDHIKYSQMRSVFLSKGGALDDHYLRLLQGGVKVKLPLLEYNSSLRIQYLTYPALPMSKGRYVALLPLTFVGYESYVFGIVLLQVSVSRYVRCGGAPILVHMGVLDNRRLDPEAFIVFDEPLKPSQSGWRYARFEFRSSSFQVLFWRSTAENDEPSTTNCKALFLLPKAAGDYFALSIKTLGISSNLSPVIVLGDSIGKLQLRDVDMHGDMASSRSALQRNHFADRMTIPCNTQKGSINVAIRRLSPANTPVPLIGIVVARYRVDMEYVEDSPHTPESGKTDAKIADVTDEEVFE